MIALVMSKGRGGRFIHGVTAHKSNPFQSAVSAQDALALRKSSQVYT